MTKFIAVYLLIYGLMHAMVYVRTKIIVPMSLRWLFIMLMISMILMPIVTRLLEKNGYDYEAFISASVAFNWMGFIFLAFVGVVLMTIFDLASWGINSVSSLNFPYLTGRLPAVCMIFAVIALCAYGIQEAKQIRISHLTIESDKLKKETGSVRIVQISDVHLGLMAGEKQLKQLIERIKSLKPDMLVCTGDLVDGNPHKLLPLSGLFQSIAPKYGKYAVTGNHEYYNGLEESLTFLKMSGFTVLRGDVRRIEPGITIVGVDDPTVVYPQSETALLSSVKQRNFTILLKHRPSVAQESLGLFDLQLSGHTHGGQIFPFGFLVAIQYPFMKGYHELDNKSKIYTNRGAGTWGPQMRILSPPEITLIEIKPAM